MTATLFTDVKFPPINKKQGHEYFVGIGIDTICEERSQCTFCVMSRSASMPPMNEMLVCEYFYFIEEPKENKQVEKFIAELSNFYKCIVLTEI